MEETARPAENSAPLVSIDCTAFNHGRFIRACLEGMMMQKTDFAFEVLVHDDASQDDTADIIREYEARYPDIIQPIYQTENQYSKGVKIAEFQFPRMRGKYVAFCEGDDYWTDPLKLQKQVDFLEANPDYSACVHQCMQVFDYKDEAPTPYNTQVKDTYGLNDLLDGCRFHTATLMARAELISIMRNPPKVLSGDRFMYLVCARYGKIKFFPEPMSVYRINRTGVSTWVTPALLKRDLNMVPPLTALYPDFPKYRYLSFIHKTIILYPPKVPFFTYLKHYFLYALYSFSFFPRNIAPLLRLTFLTTPKFAVLRLFPRTGGKLLKAYR